MQPDRGRLSLALSAMGAIALLGTSQAEAQIYTRVKPNGVIEATNVPNASDYRLTYPGKGRLIHSRGFKRVPYNGEFDRHILEAASSCGISPDLVRAVIQAESEFDHLAVSSKGAQGLMQLMPGTARRLGVADAFDPRQNIFGGAAYLKELLDLFQGDVALALAGYNAGENAVLRYKGIPPYKETRGYVRKIQGLLSAGFSGPTYRKESFGVTSSALSSPASDAARFFTPGSSARVAPLGSAALPGSRLQVGAAAPRAAAAPLAPRTYYRWSDSSGHFHVAQSPPPEGVAFAMIRGLD